MPDCTKCKKFVVMNGETVYNICKSENRRSNNMDENLEIDNVGPIPRYYHEAEMARQERNTKRWFIAWIITFVLFIASWTGFIFYEKQFTDEVWTFEATTEGEGNAIANGNGEVYYYGESEGNTPQANP